MNAIQIVRTDRPHEIREFPLGRLELYRIGGLELGRAVYEPGWRWSEHVRPTAGTELCEVSHVGLVLAGTAGVIMRDGQQYALRPGDFFAIPAGHDSWVIGDKQYVSLHLAGADTYGTAAVAPSATPDS